MRNLLAAIAVLSLSSGVVAAPLKRGTKPALTKRVPTRAVAKPAVYYDFKGARLGITLEEFRAMPITAKASYSSPMSTYGPERLWCSNDTYSDGKIASDFYLSSAEKALGVVECKFAREYKIGRDYVTLDDLWTPIGERSVRDVSYKFMNGRLYSIDITGGTFLLADVLDGLTSKYGAPDRVVNDTTQNKAGATFPHSEHHWSNPAATIVVESPWTKIDNMHVMYLTTEAAARLGAKREELNPSSSKM